MGITNKEEFNLNDLLNKLEFSDVINGLNEYFAEDETYVEIKSPDMVAMQIVLQPNNPVFQNRFYRFDAEMYLDKIIAWLRTEHGIFYYPGMEARYAKAEKRIPPFTERMKNDGALRTLKKLHKIVTDVEVSDKADSPTLIAAAIENDFAVLKQDLKNALEAKESFFETKGKLAYRKELMDYIVNAEKKYGICFSDMHDNEEFRPERIFDDLLDKMTRNEHILKDLYRDILHKQPDDLSNEDIATKILDKVLDIKERLDHKEAEVVGEIRVKRYEKELLNYIYKEYEHRTSLSDKTITYNPPSIRNTITKIISDYARNRTRVDILEGRIKCIFDKYKTKFTVDDQVINGDPTIGFMLDCINTWIRSSDFTKVVKARAEYAESLSRNTEGSDINKLISDYCNKFDIIAPSPYFSDKACVEYLFSVVDLEQQHRAAVGKQMVDDYEKDIMDRIRQEASLYGLNLPEKVDGEPLTIERVFHDLFDLMMIRGEELRTLESKCNRLNEIVEELNTLNNEIKEELP